MSTPEPQTETPPQTRTIELDIAINATPEWVWSALTTPEELARWFPPTASGTPGLGEKLLISQHAGADR